MDRSLSPTRARLINLINDIETLKDDINHSNIFGYELSVLQTQAHTLHRDLFQRIQTKVGEDPDSYGTRMHSIRQDLATLVALRQTGDSDQFDRSPRLRDRCRGR